MHDLKTLRKHVKVVPIRLEYMPSNVRYVSRRERGQRLPAVLVAGFARGTTGLVMRASDTSRGEWRADLC